VLLGIPEGKSPLGKSSRRGEDSIKLYLKEKGGVWTGLIWFRIGASDGGNQGITRRVQFEVITAVKMTVL
jgi:hypothetical protein